MLPGVAGVSGAPTAGPVAVEVLVVWTFASCCCCWWGDLEIGDALVIPGG